VSDQIGNILASMVGGVTPNIVCMMLSGVVTARVMTAVARHLRTVVCVYLENEATPQMAGGVAHMLIHTLTASISQGLSKELTHTCAAPRPSSRAEMAGWQAPPSVAPRRHQ
jgi:hypothetical protein